MKTYDTINIEDITPSTYNPRKISNTEYNKLSRSINEFGVISPIIINLKNNHIIGGHQRYEVLYDEYLDNGEYEELNLIKVGDIGWAFPSTDLKVENLSTEKAMNIALNKISGEWDVPKLETLLIDLDVDDYNLDLTGFDNLDLQEYDIDLKTNINLPSPQEQLKKELKKEEPLKEQNKKEYIEQQKEQDTEKVTDTQDNVTVYGETHEENEITNTDIEEITTDIKHGDLFQLGEHRLLCGDSMNNTDVKKLMDGTKADTVFTDPPYDLKDISYIKSIEEYCENANIFIMNSDDNIVEYLRHSNFKFIQFFVANFMFTLPRQNRAYLQHILVSHEIIGDALHCRNIGKGLRSVINMKYRGFLKDDPTPHKHQKSIDFVKFIIEHYAVENVLDLFGGSGTTLIACEELGLKCYMMEVEPKFVQVIIDRYEKLTGNKSIKLQ